MDAISNANGPFSARRIVVMPGDPGEHDLCRRIGMFRGRIIVEAT